MTTLATFNANNFFLRYRFSRNYPGSRSRDSQIEATEVAAIGYLPGAPFGRYQPTQHIVWDAVRRELAYDALLQPDGRLPDILCLQEVENIQAIRILNERYFNSHYQYSLLIDAYDPRNIDVAVLSTLPLEHVRSHTEDRDAGGNQLFRSRDCLEVDVELPDGEILSLFINHLKSKFAENDADLRRGHQKRQAQAQQVFDYISERFRGQHTTALYAVVGDLNDTPRSPYVASLVDTPRFTNILERYLGPDRQWTYYWRSGGRVSQIDYILASRALAARIDAIVSNDASRMPYIERAGVGYRELNASGEVLPRTIRLIEFEADSVTPANPAVPDPIRIDFRFPRYVEVFDTWRNNISDHCPVKVWL